MQDICLKKTDLEPNLIFHPFQDECCYPHSTDEETEAAGSEKVSSWLTKLPSLSLCRGEANLPAASVHSALLPGPAGGAGALRAVRHAQGKTQHHEQLWGG